jgi:hypothetical protein
MMAPLIQLPISAILIDVLSGLGFLTVVLMFHGSAINRILVNFDKRTKKYLGLKQYNRVFVIFYISFVLIALIHIVEIFMWSIFMFRLDLIPTPIDALLFAGSCYTTVGFVADILPLGWKSLAFYISFSGLFSLAWTTSVMIGMTNCYKDAWSQKHNLDASE